MTCASNEINNRKTGGSLNKVAKLEDTQVGYTSDQTASAQYTSKWVMMIGLQKIYGLYGLQWRKDRMFVTND